MTDAAVSQPQSQSPRDFMDAPRSVPSGDTGPVLIISDALPDRNGVGAYYRDLLDQLRQHECDATLVCPNPEKRAILKFPLPGDSTQRVWIPSPWRFRRIMKRVRPRTVIVATPGPFGLLGAWWAKRRGATLIVGFHTHFSGVTDLYNNRFLRAFSRFYFNIADKILFRYADLVLANSGGMVDLARSLGAKRVDVMGTLLPIDALSEPRSPIRPQLERVVFAGRLAVEKRVQLVADAAAELPDIRFVIAGDGPLKSEIASRAEALPNLEYTGWIARRELLEQMDLADVLVLPSYVESFGTVALEAMARQRLALVSNTCGIVDWPALADSLYQIDEGQSVTDALREIAALPSEARIKKARAAREAALRLNHSSLLHWLNVLKAEQTSVASVSA